ncbi:MAG: carboxy-S-adenosyl-L-methionine synthase CmoA [Verrucomicrobiota bacterium]
MNQSDRIYNQPLDHIAPFEFDASVVNVFEDMIQRSVPGYGLTLQLMASVAGMIKSDTPKCYDLGSSLGAGIIAIDRGLRGKGGEVIGVDISRPMIDKAAELLKQVKMRNTWRLVEDDVSTISLDYHDLCVMNFTLQFIPPESRLGLLEKIYKSLNFGGMLVLSEKIEFDDETVQEFQVEMHHNFKRLNGYSELEISQKRSALENKLVPETLEAHTSRLKRVGFEVVFPWFQAFNFVSILAVK